MLFEFVDDGAPTPLSGSLASVMRGYSADLFREDPLQAYGYAQATSTFTTGQLPGFDFTGLSPKPPVCRLLSAEGRGLRSGALAEWVALWRSWHVRAAFV